MSLRTEAINQGLTSEEFDRIVELLGREPNSVETGIFAVMWSEHCCYKSSKLHLRQLPTKGPRVVQGPGENAGIMDIGDGDVVAFKIESHNHPSFIEPTQGAATGVGGILRDIFTMGARPVAVLDSLCFGEPSHEKTAYLVHGVVAGVGGYGNCIGIPNVGGEVHFDASYNGNNLVNAMAVGTAKREVIHKGIAKGAGNLVFYLGSKTGKDGIHGATMASEEFGAGNEERRPTVQVGDAFTEKLLLEACLEMMQESLLVGIQDMGAAGIACSTFEMSARGGSGMDVNLDLVPLRQAGMSAWEIFLSESQERMLLVSTRSNAARVKEIAAKWDIDCVEIGTVSDSGRVRAWHHGELVVDLPFKPVTDGAPVYDRPWKSPPVKKAALQPDELGTVDVSRTLLELLSSPNLSSRRFVFRQYDQTVGADTVVKPGSDAAIVRMKGTAKGIGMTVDCQPHLCEADPYEGIKHVVAEGVRNLAVSGVEAIGVTNCLNFGNPEDPMVMGQLRESIRGLSDACRFFEIPVTGGNVSLYNQTANTNILPTPTIGIVGLIKDVSKRVTADFKKSGSVVAVLGRSGDGRLYQSEFARWSLKRDDLGCAPINLEEERSLQKTILQMIDEGLLESAHDSSEGGLAIALVESCLEGKDPVGISIEIPEGQSSAVFLFGENPSQVVISFDSSQAQRIQIVAQNHGVPLTQLGRTQTKGFEIKGSCRFELPQLAEARDGFFEAL